MDKVKSYIEANKERFISELFDLLRIPSISAQSEHKPDMTRCAEWLAAALAKAGADRTEVFPTEGNPVVYAEKIVDPKAKTVLVYGHYDVMPVDPRGEWRTEPFEPVIKDGRIWGRGADDDKGQLWMHAKAFEAMCATESLPCNVKFMLEGEEEIGALYDALEPYLTTDMSRGRVINMLWDAREYTRTALLEPEGNHEIGSDGFMEFHADDDALKAMVLDLFYKEVQ